MWKRFEAGRSRSPKEKVFQVFRYLRGFGNGHLSASPQTGADEDMRRPDGLNMQAYIIAKQRKQEIESQKAMLASLSRHDRWKAGGPI